jgi:hypothetical protein
MFGFSKKVADPHPYDAFVADLDRVISAAKSRHVGLRAIADMLASRGATLKVQAAVTYAPRKVYSGNLPE